MKFTVYDVMEKGLYLRQALEAAGHQAVPFDEAELLLLDCDWAWAAPRPQLIDQATSRGVKVALYPHGGQPTAFIYDGLTEPHPGVDLRLEHGPGSIEVGVFAEGDLKQEAHGWLYCPTAPFEPCGDPKTVLFAPLHPNIEAMQNGGGPDPAPALNRHVYWQLLSLGFDVTVSVVGPLWKNGIWFHPRARLVANPNMGFTNAFALIQEADVVVAAGTLAAAAVACGKPLVMLGGHDCCDYIGGEYRRATHADEYADWFRYPINAENRPLDEAITAACGTLAFSQAWRERWVGDDGTAGAVRSLEHLVGVKSEQSNVTIEGVRAEAKATPLA